MGGLLMIQVGGTIDKGYPPRDADHGYGFEIGEPAFMAILTRANAQYKWSQASVMRKDSLDMDCADRVKIHDYVLASSYEKVVITHGTDTIYLTAKALRDIPRKTIVLTGAMLPAAFRDSDADFNLGMAIGAVQYLPWGVYIALYGEVKRWDEFLPR